MDNNSVSTKRLLRRKYLYIIIPTFIGSIIAYLDRVNIAYATLMNGDIGSTAQVFGMGSGIFFVGYVLFEVPGALISERWSPPMWIARIMINWGFISGGGMDFVSNAWQFYLVRFLLGAAEVSFYPVMYPSVFPRWVTPEERPQGLALMLTSL